MKAIEQYFEPRYVKYQKKVVLKLVKHKRLRITDEKLIENSDSPTGKVYIGVSKRPLQKLTRGYGYKGVLLQTDNRVFIQCHYCGKWARRLSSAHLATHRLTKEKYCSKYGLLKTTALVSDELSQSLQQRGRMNILAYNNLNSLKANKALQKQREEAALKGREARKALMRNDEHNNKYGLCEKQLGFRLIEYIRKYHFLPTNRAKGEGNQICKALFRRYGSINEGFKHYNIPTLHRTGSTVELIAPNNKQYFFNYNNHSYNPAAIYKWMVDQCPVLGPNAINPFSDK